MTSSRAVDPGSRAAISRISPLLVGDVAIVDGGDQVVRLQPGALGRRPRRDVLDQRADRARQLQRRLQVGIDIAQRDADIAARDARPFPSAAAGSAWPD